MTVETYKFYRDILEYTKNNNELVVEIIKAHYPKIENPDDYTDESILAWIIKHELDYFFIMSIMKEVEIEL